MSKRFTKISLLTLVVGLVLSGCSLSAQSLDSESVMKNFSESLSNLGSFHYETEINLNGNILSGLGENLSSSRIKLVGDVKSANAVSPEFTLLAQIFAQSPDGPISISGQVIGLKDYTYFKLTDLLVPTLLPISVGTDSRWYKIKHVLGGDRDPSILGSGGKSSVSPEQLEAIREIISTYQLFDIVKELPDETVAGQRSYHYQAKINSDALKQIIEQFNGILQTNNSTVDLEVYENYLVDLWISKRDFSPTRIHIADDYVVDNEIIEFDFVLGMTNHNLPLTIIAPEVSEDIDGLNWLTGSDLF